MISPAGPIGITFINNILAYPNFSGAISDLYIEFTVDKELPAGSSVEITFNKSIGTLFNRSSESQANKCWASENYSDC